MMAWRPIATVPDDVETALVYTPDYVFTDAGDVAFCVAVARREDGEWVDDHSGGTLRPTHWLPLEQPDSLENST